MLSNWLIESVRNTMISELLFLATLAVFWLYFAKLPPDYPPTPPISLPFVGHMHYLLPHLRQPWEGLYHLYNKYGRNGLMAMHFGPYKFVLLGEKPFSTFLIIKYVMTKRDAGEHQLVRDIFRREEANTRCEDKALSKYIETVRGTLNYGIVNGVGKKWQEQSRFMTTALREFGFGKSGMEEIIIEEVKSFKSHLETECNKTIYFHVSTVAYATTICIVPNT